MKKVGLTGGIGSGKTLVCRVFEKLGVPVFYADQEAKWLYDHEETVKQALISHFGTELYDQEGLKRKVLANKIFHDPGALKRVNAIVHPFVRRRFHAWAARQSHKPYVIEEAAILFESGAHKELDHTILVYAPEKLRIKRVMERDRSDEESVRARMTHQTDDEEKKEKAEWVIYNDGSRMVIPQILDIHKQLIDKN
jgi:dephospho-CoA kinase